MTSPILTSRFAEVFGSNSEPDFHCFAPARVNLIGEHIDYIGGKVLPAAISRGIYAAVKIRNDRSVMVASEGRKEVIQFELSKNLAFEPKRAWANLVAGIMQQLLTDGYPLQGMEILLHSDMPEGSGLSSSAAVGVISAWLALSAIGENPDRTYLAKLAMKTENEFLGLNCGIMDPFSIANGKADHAMLLNCETLHFEYVPVQFERHELVVINSHQSRTLVGSAYNDRRASCELAAEKLGVSSLSEVSDISIINRLADDKLRKRAKHAVSECNRVLTAVELLKSGDAIGFGNSLKASHESLSVDYEVSTVEIDHLMHAANTHDACAGARITGAGFGGCCIGLIEKGSLEDFRKVLESAYFRSTGLKCSIFPAKIGQGVLSIALK